MTVQERVGNGMALLDAKRPGWYKEVDLKTLNIDSCDKCVLGQLYGGYEEGVNKVFPDYIGVWTHGFCPNIFESSGLTEEWVKQIQARLDIDKIQEQIQREELVEV